MPPTNGDENQKSNEEDTSVEEDGFLARFFSKSRQYALESSFRLEVDAIIKYLQVLKELTDAIQNICLSGKSYHVDPKSEVQNSGWRYMPSYLKKVEFLKNNQTEADSLWRLFDKLGHVEENNFYDIIHVEHDSNIYNTATKHREEIEQLNVSVEKLVKTCNERRKKVARAEILIDLRAQGIKYQKAVFKLDEDVRMLLSLQVFVKENQTFHREHFKQSLVVIHRLTTGRNDLMVEDVKKKQREKARSSKSAYRKVTDKTLKK